MNLQKMMQQAQQMQSKLAEMQEKLAQEEMEGTSGGGAVRVVLNGKKELRKINLDPSVIDPQEQEVLEDLIMAAFRDASGKVETHANEQMGKLTSGMGLPPGLKLPF